MQMFYSPAEQRFTMDEDKPDDAIELKYEFGTLVYEVGQGGILQNDMIGVIVGVKENEASYYIHWENDSRGCIPVAYWWDDIFPAEFVTEWEGCDN